MPSHTSLPPPSAGSGPRSPSPADAFGAAGSAPNVKGGSRGSAGPAPVSAGTLADRAAEAVFGGEDDARNSAGLITSFAPSRERRKHGKAPRVRLADEFRKGHDHPPELEGSAALRGRRIFPCTACGACCRSLSHAPIYAGLDRGDGICRHFDTGTNLCRIYEIRPKICRVTEMFEAFEDRLTWEEYVDLNLQSCRELRARTRTPEPGSTANWKE